LKIKRRDYTGYDDDEFAEGKQGMKRAVLAKYDEEIQGTHETVGIYSVPQQVWISLNPYYFRGSVWEALLRPKKSWN